EAPSGSSCTSASSRTGSHSRSSATFERGTSAVRTARTARATCCGGHQSFVFLSSANKRRAESHQRGKPSTPISVHCETTDIHLSTPRAHHLFNAWLKWTPLIPCFAPATH